MWRFTTTGQAGSACLAAVPRLLVLMVTLLAEAVTEIAAELRHEAGAPGPSSVEPAFALARMPQLAASSSRVKIHAEIKNRGYSELSRSCLGCLHLLKASLLLLLQVEPALGTRVCLHVRRCLCHLWPSRWSATNASDRGENVDHPGRQSLQHREGVSASITAISHRKHGRALMDRLQSCPDSYRDRMDIHIGSPAVDDGVCFARLNEFEAWLLDVSEAVRPIVDLNPCDDGVVGLALVNGLRDELLQILHSIREHSAATNELAARSRRSSSRQYENPQGKRCKAC